MSQLLADIFVTVRPLQKRIAQTVRSLKSLLENTDRSQFRLTVCVDGAPLSELGLDPEDPAWDEFAVLCAEADYVLTSRENVGLGPTINRAVAHIKTVNEWAGDELAPMPGHVAPYLCMLQDDVLYTSNWLPTLASRFRAYGQQWPLGFASGIECIEHPVRKCLMHDGSIVLKDWVRATCLFSTRDYWESLMPIPRWDPETRNVRAKPNDGIGSGVDWHVIRNHPNSVCQTGRTNLVMPGLLAHIGYASSTWLKREMPESDADKEASCG